MEINMPRRQGYVSLWAGRADSASSLDEYMNVVYSEDGDLIPSAFAHDFAIKSYDEDFREAQFWEVPSRKVRDLLTGHSYDTEIIPAFVKICGESLSTEVNAVVLLYNFEFNEGPKDNAGDNVRLRYLGTVVY